MGNIDRFRPPSSYLDNFMRESNKIEGEHRLNPGDISAIREIVAFSASGKPLTEDILLGMHKKLGTHLKEPWVGKYRECNVTVGSYAPPGWTVVPHLMSNFVLDWEAMNSWKAHNLYETIHPFQDLNGRTGRLIWLWKALQEGWNWQRDFLHEYYYQTLQNACR
jgi:Fic family protein